MLSEKQGHVWFRYDLWLWPTYQSADSHIDKPGYKVRSLLDHVKKLNFWVRPGFSQVSERFFKKRMKNKRGHVSWTELNS